MIKMIVQGSEKQVYSDSVGTHGKAEILAFMVHYCENINDLAGPYMIKNGKKSNGEYYYIDLFGKWFNTVTEKQIDEYNKSMEVTK